MASASLPAAPEAYPRTLRQHVNRRAKYPAVTQPQHHLGPLALGYQRCQPQFGCPIMALAAVLGRLPRPWRTPPHRVRPGVEHNPDCERVAGHARKVARKQFFFEKKKYFLLVRVGELVRAVV
jgi:hypothetical protein